MPPKIKDLIADLERAGFVCGCHGDDEKRVFEELCRIVDEAIAIYHQEGKLLPPATAGRDFANRMQSVA